MCENKVKRIFETKRDDVAGGGENYIIITLIVITLHRELLVSLKEDKMGGACRSKGGDENTYKILIRKGGYQLGLLRLDSGIIFKWILKEVSQGKDGVKWPRTESIGFFL
jgi:hypothetical protein